MGEHRKSSQRRGVTVVAGGLMAGAFLLGAPAGMAFAAPTPVGPVSPAAVSGGSAVGNNLQNFLGGVGNNLQSFNGQLGANTQSIAGGLGTNLQKAALGTSLNVQGVVGGTAGNIQKIAGGAGTNAQNFFGGLGNNLQKIFGGGKTKVTISGTSIKR